MPAANAPAPTAVAGMIIDQPAGAAAAASTAAAESPPPSEIARKIIYDAQINLIVEAIDPAAARLAALVQQYRGYIAEQSLSGSPGATRSGRWKVRIPVDAFESFVQGALGLGELELNQRTSQDITEQFYDIQARVKNKKVEEQTLLKILEERSGNLEDVLKVQVELSRVRGEIEQLEGRLRVLDNLSALATVTINLREREKFQPPAPAAPTFSTRIARAWDGSIQDLRRLGENLVLGAVAIALYIPFFLLALALAFLILRWLVRTLLRNLPRLWEIARRPLNRPAPPSQPQP
jgi:hypothetical protein